MRINWFDGHFEIPIILGIIIILIICVLILILTFRSSVNTVWGCPECGKRFKLKWYKRGWIHDDGNAERAAVTCPFCHKKVVCSQSYDQTSECERF